MRRAQARLPAKDGRRGAADRSTGLRLAGVGGEGRALDLRLRREEHVVYDPDLGRPAHAVTAANVNDITAAKEMPVEAGATYVSTSALRLGFFAKRDALGCRLVTRFKADTPLNSPRELPLPPGSTLLGDRIGFQPARQAMNRKNSMQDGVREIVVRTETGETLRLMTTISTRPPRRSPISTSAAADRAVLPADEQTLRIAKFVGRSENAVRIQIAVALIDYLLVRALQQITKETHGFLELVDKSEPLSCTVKSR